MTQKITIKEVLSKKELRLFIRFPRKLYANSPNYVPALDNDEYQTLTKHPALDFCSLRLWLAYRDGKVVGRIAAIINHKHNELKQQKRIRFGWFDVINDEEVAQLLFSKVEQWGIENELTEISGPSRFSNMEKQGLLIEGFDKMPPISSEYNFDYYPQLLNNLNFKKEVDYMQYKVKVTDVPEKIEKLSHLISERYKVKIKEVNSKKELLGLGVSFFKMINESFVKIYNFIPLTDKEIDYHIKQNFAFADKDLINLLIDEKDELIGFSFCLPSLSQAFRRANGKLFPFGWYAILKALRKNKMVNLYLTGVIPEWKNSGIHSLYHYQLNKTFIRKGYQYAITNPQLENNPANRIWEKYEAEIVFRRRCYVKPLPIISCNTMP